MYLDINSTFMTMLSRLSKGSHPEYLQTYQVLPSALPFICLGVPF